MKLIFWKKRNVLQGIGGSKENDEESMDRGRTWNGNSSREMEVCLGHLPRTTASHRSSSSKYSR